jgi:FtsZ-interacting cell division protein ZipA
MTDLNTSLWGAGGALIVGVVIYNFWQEYKAKKNVQRAFGDHKDDVLMNAEPREVAGQSKGRQEPRFDEAAPVEAEVNTAEELVARTNENQVLPIDDFIDGIITMDFENPVRGDKLLAEIQSVRRVGNKPVHFVGVTDNHRENLSHAGSYSQLIAGVQLVNRSGPLNELEYSELVMQLRVIADNLNAFLDVPDMKHVMDSGRDLSLFVSEHDAQLSVNVKSKGAPWDVSTLMAAMEKLGFDARPDGRLVMLDGEGGALFTLAINGNSGSLADHVTSRITLLLDVPCVSPKRGGFSAMVACAKSLGLRLGGTLVDDGDAPIDDATLAQIQEQVEVFYSAMQAAEIPAGSTRAVRIFS